MRKVMPTVLAVAALSAGAPVQAQTFCMYDPVGAQGAAFALAKDYALAAKKWGANLELKAYTDERVAAEDFKAGQCDGVGITGLRGRQYNGYVGSIDSIGALPSYNHLRTVLQVLASPASEKDMVSGQYEVVGIFPLGAAYVFVRDRAINSIEKAAGKKIAVLDFDKSQARMVQQLGAQPVASDITNFTAKFNNGQVDIVVAPGIAFKPFEMYKGLGTKGAIYRFPLVQLT
ncbi:MAG: putative solute-binding protein, partial [Paraperlucidibaca sp.]